MTKTYTINALQKPTKEQLEEIEKAKKSLLYLMKIVKNCHLR